MWFRVTRLRKEKEEGGEKAIFGKQPHTSFIWLREVWPADFSGVMHNLQF